MANPAEVDAVVLVGGQGTRLRPLTLSAPKPMLPTAGLPFLTHLLSRIGAVGIEHVVLGTSYKPEVFESEFGDGSSGSHSFSGTWLPLGYLSSPLNTVKSIGIQSTVMYGLTCG